MTSREPHIATAGRWLIGNLVVYFAGSVLLSVIGFEPRWMLVIAWLMNAVTAFYLAKGARALGRNGVLYGVCAAVGPPAAIALWFQLSSADRLRVLDASE